MPIAWNTAHPSLRGEACAAVIGHMLYFLLVCFLLLSPLLPLALQKGISPKRRSELSGWGSMPRAEVCKHHFFGQGI